MNVAKKAPVAFESSMALFKRATGCSFEPYDRPVYRRDPRGAALRVLRVELKVSFLMGADWLGISVVEMSGLERGSHTFVDDADWECAFAVLRTRAAEKGER